MAADAPAPTEGPIAPEPVAASEPPTPPLGTPRTFMAPIPPSVNPRGLFTTNFLVQLLTWKYRFGGPPTSFTPALGMAGDGHLGRGTLIGALQALEPVVQPLYEAIKDFNRNEPLVAGRRNALEGVRRV